MGWKVSLKPTGDSLFSRTQCPLGAVHVPIKMCTLSSG